MEISHIGPADLKVQFLRFSLCNKEIYTNPKIQNLKKKKRVICIHYGPHVMFLEFLTKISELT